jgi:hypothetical protein
LDRHLDQRLAAAVAPPPYSLLRDIVDGAVLGDAAPRLHLAGALTQIILGYVPVIGTLCALRDFVVCQRNGHRIAAALNLFSVLPVFGGVPKTMAVITNFIVAGKNGKELLESFQEGSSAVPAAAAATTTARQGSNIAAIFSLLLVLLIPLLALIALDRVPDPPGPISVFAAGALVSLVAIITGHLGVRHAIRATGPRHGGCATAFGLTLGYLYFILFAAAIGLTLLAPSLGLPR